MARMRNAFRMLLGLLEGKRPLGMFCCRRQDKFVMEHTINKIVPGCCELRGYKEDEKSLE